MEAPLSLLFTLALFYPILTVSALLNPAGSTTAYTPTTTPSPTAAISNNRTTEFIRTSCQNTRYPDLCYTSLSIYANAIRENPSRLARAAIGVSLLRAKYTAAYFNNLARQAEYQAEPRMVTALHDCVSVLSDAIGQIKDSLAQIKSAGRGGSGGEKFRFEMSNVQTWMSAALTYEETCRDGLEEVADGGEIEGNDHIQSVEEVTSNALALVNAYVSGVSSP